ncbi:MAG TPA: M20/M25/M40 family metallo-hydrolase [Solirubrobacterales bacterium]|nr:M20/M25/M40 family metallo-hydrolase [Solirubrobacterales bacterium]
MSRFVRLCEIASPTGEEGEIAAAVATELSSFGLEVFEDGAAGPAEAGAGNLLARIEGEKPGYVLFCAHLDTVPHDGPIQVVLDDGIYRSAGETILGADNKAAVAVLMELANRHRDRKPPIGIELLFTVAEEQGLRGAANFDVSLLKSSWGFVLDHATDIGEVITAAPSHHRINAEFTGVEAHSGLDPESGRSAIAAAAAAISEMRLGRLDEETTANIGTISGGSSGNIIPGSCRVSGEARSIDPDRVIEVIAAMSDSMISAASEAGCEVDIVTEEVFRGYRTAEDSPSLLIAEEALRRRGHEPRRVSTGGGSDANVFMAAGIDTLLLANGTYDNHTHEESVPQANLAEMLEICEEILVGAAARC